MAVHLRLFGLPRRFAPRNDIFSYVKLCFMQNAISFIKYSALPVISNVLFPPHCAVCAEPVDSSHSLCINCFEDINFIADPKCTICGVPFTFDLSSNSNGKASEADSICAACMTLAPAFSRHRSALIYDNASRKLITNIKYGDKTNLIPLAARLMISAGVDILSKADYIIPVPIHWRRMLKRKFNQSQLLALEINKLMGSSAELMPNMLQRIKHTPPQASLDWRDRQKNVKNAFGINHKQADIIKGKNVVLVDDVITTGATIRSCVKALKQAKPNNVYVLTLARRMPIN